MNIEKYILIDSAIYETPPREHCPSFEIFVKMYRSRDNEHIFKPLFFNRDQFNIKKIGAETASEETIFVEMFPLWPKEAKIKATSLSEAFSIVEKYIAITYSDEDIEDLDFFNNLINFNHRILNHLGIR